MAQIIGMNSLLSKLNSLTELIQDGALDGVQKSIDIMRDDAKQLCPVDTGELRDSIVSEIESNTGTLVKGTVTAEADYAVAVEFGTGQSVETRAGIVLSGDNSHVGRAPTPFMYPAYKLNEEDTLDSIAEAVKNNIRKVAKR